MSKATGLLLDRAAIFGKQDARVEELYIPEWQGTVRIKALTAAERDQFEQAALDQRGKGTRLNAANLRARLAVLACVDADGNRLFADEDAAMLGTKSAAAVDRIFDVAATLAGILDGDLDELLGNSKPGQSDGSTSG